MLGKKARGPPEVLWWPLLWLQQCHMLYSLAPWAVCDKVACRLLSSPSRCSVRGLIGSVPSGRVSGVVWFNPVRPKGWLCAMSGDFARGQVEHTQISLLLVLLF